jgi:hypothetical protein
MKDTILAILILSLVFACVISMMWLEGSAKSAYLMETKGIDLPWHSTVLMERDAVYRRPPAENH